jgi:hypothetical protein
MATSCSIILYLLLFFAPIFLHQFFYLLNEDRQIWTIESHLWGGYSIPFDVGGNMFMMGMTTG